ncbi:MAG: hypothetical protein DI533_12525 [Cereibacter sphaeroides]|uniref:Uncharacterized protein n=1 Tax=Cereibacter sphaeroides TaxID=1063 RepID=A0A2W5SFL4_CERSP|nr:MAG: hypothetical protein DI533_12525 [Cereibacter sphaeroides]
MTSDHAELYDTEIARRYFAKFERITGHLPRIAAELEVQGKLTRLDARVIGGYVQGIAATFRTLSYKYLMTGREALAGKLTFDRHESGFPVAQELMVMANDAQQAERHLAGMASEPELKDRMIRQIVGDLTIPTKLQFALSQRYYYDALLAGGLFWARNDPDAQWLEDRGDRRVFLVHWAVYDHGLNLPVIYLMEVEDSGRTALPNDDRRWPEVRAHLMAQSLAGLKLLTIAQGFDKDFDDLHPKRLRRIHIGPMYSDDFTLQSGPISEVLADANAAPGEDWALVWTVEDLLSEREETVKEGWFGSDQRQIFTLDPFAGRGAETGATTTERMVILPERPFQVLAERNPAGFADVRKYVVGSDGRVMAVR